MSDELNSNDELKKLEPGRPGRREMHISTQF